MVKNKNVTSFLIISILGTLGHFVYEWSGKIYTLGLFFPVNESTWEHLKLLFFPAIIYYTVINIFADYKSKNYISSAAISIFTGMISIVVLFYTYRGVIGKNIDFLNIFIYYLGVLTTVITFKKLKNSNKFISDFFNIISLTILIITSLLFAFYSYNPPSLGIFLPPAV